MNSFEMMNAAARMVMDLEDSGGVISEEKIQELELLLSNSKDKLGGILAVRDRLSIETAQHREMLDQVLNLFELHPDYDLDIMQHGQDLTDVTNRVLTGMRDLFKNEWKPDLVLVHVDTTTCFATALAAFYEGIEIGHIEAGLRTGNLQSPFPEEANRVLVSRIATYHFAPTKTNVENLINEGVNSKSIIQTGNTVIDSLIYISEKLNGFSLRVADTILPSLIKEESKF